MTIKPPDMNSCAKKTKILGGPNDGLAYDPGDPCPDNYYWDEDTQDCLPNPP